jgi:uncharacterized protein (DUF58 family)
VSATKPILPPPVQARARPHRRFPVAFGPRFFLLLLVGLVWLGPAWWEKRFLYAMAVWDLLVVAAWLADWRQLPKPELLELNRVWTRPAALASRAAVRLELTNRGRVPVRVLAVDDVAPALRRAPPELELHVPAGRTTRAEYTLEPRERGDARLGSVFLRYQSPWRLAERWAAAPLEQTVRIYPNLEEAQRHLMYLIRSRQIELEKRLKRQRGLGREFESLREYRDGDEFRDICWTATARRGKLITRVYQVERSQSVWVVLDTGRLLRAQVDKLAKLDYAVGAALGLAQVALYSGDRVGLLAYGRAPQQLVPPAHGSAHLRTLLERLALVRNESAEADHLRAAETLLRAQTQRALVVWVTDLAETPATPDVIESAMQLAGRHLVLFLVIGHPEMSRLVATRPPDRTALYRYAAAQEVQQRRELLLRQLRQRGALALEVEAARLSTALVNNYLEVKERALL